MAISPGSNKRTKDHGKNGHLDRRGERFSARRGNDSELLRSFICRRRSILRESVTYFSKIPSNTMVRKILNLLKTVNMGKLGERRTFILRK